MTTTIACNECDGDIGDSWIMVTVYDEGEYVSGFLCSEDCLVDFAAGVMAMRLDDKHEGWGK